MVFAYKAELTQELGVQNSVEIIAHSQSKSHRKLCVLYYSLLILKILATPLHHITYRDLRFNSKLYTRIFLVDFFPSLPIKLMWPPPPSPPPSSSDRGVFLLQILGHNMQLTPKVKISRRQTTVTVHIQHVETETACTYASCISMYSCNYVPDVFAPSLGEKLTNSSSSLASYPGSFREEPGYEATSSLQLIPGRWDM